MYRLIFLSIFCLTLLVMTCDQKESHMIEPKATKIQHSFTLHNQTINDEYAWLRDKNWPKVTDTKILEYLESENSYFEHFLSPLQERKEQIFQELKGRIKLDDQSPYIKKDNYYYYTRTEVNKEYPIYCRKFNDTDAPEELILDVNQLVENKSFTRIGAISVSPDHKLLAYSIDFTGNEKYTIRIYNIADNTYLIDEIPDTIGDIVWHESVFGFFYTPTTDNWRCDKVLFHTIGNKSKDKLILHEPDNLYQVDVSKSADRKYIIISIGGHDNNELHIISMLDETFSPQLLKKRQEGLFHDIEHHEGYFYLKTNENAQNFHITRIHAVDFVTSNWEEYIKEEPEQYLSDFDITKDYLILNYTVLGLPLIKVHDLNSGKTNILRFPDRAFNAGAASTNFDENDIRVGYSSLARPNTTYSYNFLDDKLSIIKVQEIPTGFDSDEYNVERIFANTDNVSVPITIFYKKSLFKKDGSNPLYLYGYGSYGIGIPVSFRNSAVSIADRGFVFAIAHIRGGDELGHQWYEAAKFLNKERTFNDFIACAQKLIDEKYTTKGNIVISGGSAGGLLIGVSINQAPDLFKAAITHVPFVDILNTMLDTSLPLTPGEFKEWGNPQELDYFNYIKSYSPYDNLKQQNYSAMMVTAGLSDPRVGYWEAAKWVARIRDLNTGNNPIIFKVNMDFGHQGASGRFEYLKEAAEELVFMFKIFDR